MSGLAGSVSEARRAELAKEWREAVDADAGVLTTHTLAIQSVDDSLMAVEADAQAEAERRQALRGVVRDFYEAVLALDDDTVDVDLHNLIELTHARFGLSGGQLFRVLGVDVNAEAGTVRLVLWG